MQCPNCSSEVPAGELFCGACGTDVSTAVPNPGTASLAAPAVASPTLVAVPSPTPAGPVLLTLSFDGKDFPVSEGGKVVIAREDSDKCTPDLGIAANTVSSTPVEVTA